MPLQDLEDWGIKLIYQLIVHKAAHTNLSLKDGDTPLHCALKLALKNGMCILCVIILIEYKLYFVSLPR